VNPTATGDLLAMQARLQQAEEALHREKRHTRYLDGKVNELQKKLAESKERAARAERDLLERDHAAAQQTEALNEPLDEVRTGEYLVQFMRRQCAMEVSTSRHHELTPRAGLLARHLTTSCLLSLEKIPEACATVLFMMFGDLSEEAMGALCRSAKAYSAGIERANFVDRYCQKADFCRTNEEPLRPESVLHGCLIQDASDKAGKHLVMKCAATLNVNGSVALRALDTDVTHTKKGLVGSELTAESLTTELGNEGPLRLTCCTADGFGLTEARYVQAELDRRRREADLDVKEALKVHSSVIPGQVYDPTEGGFGEARLQWCSMHRFDLMVRVLLLALLLTAGLKNDAAPAQLIFSLAYYWRKMCEAIRALFLHLAGGDWTDLLERVLVLWRSMVTPVDHRWLSKEVVCETIEGAADVAAPPELEERARQMYSDNPAMWEELKRICVCIHDPTKLSGLMLTMVVMANTAPGKDSGELYKNLPRLLSFLASPTHRCILVIVSAFAKLHHRWVSELDSRSTVLSEPSCVGANLIESIIVERRILTDMAALSVDWRAALPVAAQFVLREAARAQHTLHLENGATLAPFLDTLMQEGETLKSV
jgi:type II secretory pathway component PulJ